MVLQNHMDDSWEWSPHMSTMYIDPQAPNSKKYSLGAR